MRGIDSPLWILLAGFAAPLALLWYARLIGRYGWLVTHTPLKRKRRAKRPAGVGSVNVEDPWAAPPAEAAADDDALKEAIQADPSSRATSAAPERTAAAALDEEEDEWTVNKKPYGVMDDAQARESWQERKVDPLAGEEGYEVTEAPPEAPLAAPFSLTSYYETYWKEEAKRRARIEAPRPPKPTFALAFGAGLFRFPIYVPTLMAWFALTILTLPVLFLVYLIVLASRAIAIG